MKKILMLVLAAAVLTLLSFSAKAEDNKTIIRVDNKSISIQIGHYEYVAERSAPDKLSCVRVWKGLDSLAYDLTATSCDYSRTATVEGKGQKRMTDAEAALEWAKHMRVFELLKKRIEVQVDSKP